MMQRTGKYRIAIGAAVIAAAMLVAGCSNKRVLPSETTPSSGTASATTTTEATTTTTETTVTESETPRETPGTFDPIGEAYYKECKPEDIMTDKETGIRYIKNQLQISCDPGTPKDKVEKIVKEAGAEIVGYIEFTSDFQIEFKEDKTVEQLKEHARKFEEYPFVRSSTLHYAITMEPD